MTDNSIRRELFFPHPPEDVWRALTESDVLEEWLMPNDFEASVGHRFTFRTQPNPQAGFDGVVRCEVLECAPPSRLAYSWVAGPLDTRVSYRLEREDEGTRLFFEHSGFDASDAAGAGGRRGAEHGWEIMLEKLEGVTAALAAKT